MVGTPLTGKIASAHLHKLKRIVEPIIGICGSASSFRATPSKTIGTYHFLWLSILSSRLDEPFSGSMQHIYGLKYTMCAFDRH